MDVVADFPADAESAEPVQQGEALLDDPAVHPQAGTLGFAATSEDRRDPSLADLLAVFVVVVGAVGIDRLRTPPEPPTAAPAAGTAWISGMS